MEAGPESHPSAVVAALDAAGVAAVLMDELGNILSATAAAGALAGSRPEALQSRRFESLFITHDRPGIMDYCSAPSVRQPYTFESTLKAGNGREIPVAVALTGLLEPQRSKPLVLGVINDRELASHSQRGLQVAQKYSIVGTYAAGIAHDFNNMLAVVAGNAELALTEDDHSRSKDRVRNALQATQVASEIVRKILGFVRHRERNAGTLDLGKVLRDCAELMASLVPPDVQLIADVDPETGLVQADISDIQQILVNLVTNARQALAATGGTINVRLSAVSLIGRSASATGLPDGEYLELVVSDDGPGIPADVQGRVFEPFFTTKPPEEGTGLGLTVVKDIAVGLGGQVTMDTAVGGGCSVGVILPRVAAPECGVEPERQTPSSLDSYRVLLVEDDPDVLAVVASTLQSLGLAVTAAREAAEALRQFQADPYRFDFVLTDLLMPDLSGLELIERIRAFRSDTPIAVMTGQVEALTEQAVAAYDIACVLQKPFLREGIETALSQALDGRLGAPTS